MGNGKMAIVCSATAVVAMLASWAMWLLAGVALASDTDPWFAFPLLTFEGALLLWMAKAMIRDADWWAKEWAREQREDDNGHT